MTTATEQQAVAVLRHLTSGKDLINTAAATGWTVDFVRDIASKHGWPNPPSMKRALEILERRNGGTAPAAPSPTSDLLERARNHSQTKIRNKATKVDQLIKELRADLAADQEAEKARKRIQELQEQIDAERAKLGLKVRSNHGNGSSNLEAVRRKQQEWLDAHQITAEELRRWAAERGLNSRGSILSKDVRTAYEASLNQAAES